MKTIPSFSIHELEEITSLLNEIEEGQKKMISEYHYCLEKQKKTDELLTSFFSFLVQKKEEYMFFGDDQEALAVVDFIENCISKFEILESQAISLIISQKESEAQWKTL